MSQNLTTYKALYPSTYASVAEARQSVGVFARTCGFSPSDVSDIVLAVGEACNNAAEHGHVAGGQFTVGCVFNRGVFKAEVLDEGPGFDSALANQVPGDPLVPIGRGRGIPIMCALMDRVTYGPTKHGTTVILEKRMAKTARKSSDRVPEPVSSASSVGKARDEVVSPDSGYASQPR